MNGEVVPLEDNEIVELYLSRNEDAISQTTAKYGTQIKTIAYRILNDWESAEECENDTYLKAWNSIPPQEPRDYLFAYLGKIVRNIALDRYKENRRKKRFVVQCELTQEMQECLPANNKDVVSEMENHEILQMIDRYLASCPVEKRKIFVRRYWYFDTIQQISETFGMTQSAVKMQLSRMRAELKKYLEEGGYGL